MVGQPDHSGSVPGCTQESPRMAPRRLFVRLRYAPFVPGPDRNRATAGTKLPTASSGCAPRTIVAPRRLSVRLRCAPFVPGPDRIRATGNVNVLRARSGCTPRTIAAPCKLPVASVRALCTRNGPKSGGFASWSIMSSVSVYYSITRIFRPRDPMARVSVLFERDEGAFESAPLSQASRA